MLPACSEEEILKYLENKNNQCLVITDSLLTVTGHSLIAGIREKFNTVKIIVLIHTIQVPVLKNLVNLGASALVSRLTRGQDLEEAILHVQQSGEPVYCHRILKILVF